MVKHYPPYDKTIDPGRFPIRLPENINNFTRVDLDFMISGIGSVPLNLKELKTLEDITNRQSLLYNYLNLAKFLPHPVHKVCTAECALLANRELTLLLWASYQSAKFLHDNNSDFDDSHLFLIDILASMARCMRAKKALQVGEKLDEKDNCALCRGG